MKRFLENEFLYYVTLTFVWSVLTAFSFVFEIILSRSVSGSSGYMLSLKIEYIIEDFLILSLKLFFISGMTTVMMTLIVNYIIMNEKNRRQVFSHGFLFLSIIGSSVYFFSITYFIQNWKTFSAGYFLTLTVYAVLQYFRNNHISRFSGSE